MGKWRGVAPCKHIQSETRLRNKYIQPKQCDENKRIGSLIRFLFVFTDSLHGNRGQLEILAGAAKYDASCTSSGAVTNCGRRFENRRNGNRERITLHLTLQTTSCYRALIKVPVTIVRNLNPVETG